MREKIIMALYLLLAASAAFNAIIAQMGVQSLKKTGANYGYVQYLALWLVLAALMFGSLAFVGCEGAQTFRAEIETEPRSMVYELRLNGEPEGTRQGPQRLAMHDSTRCVAVRTLSEGRITVTIWMERSWDNALLYGSARCCGRVSNNEYGRLVAVCKSSSDCDD